MENVVLKNSPILLPFMYLLVREDHFDLLHDIQNTGEYTQELSWACTRISFSEILTILSGKARLFSIIAQNCSSIEEENHLSLMAGAI